MGKIWKLLKISLVVSLLLVFLTPSFAYYIPVSTRQYQGLSTEAKPTTGVSKGSSFTELDTSSVYIYNGTTWYEQTVTELADLLTQVEVLQTDLDALTILVDGVELDLDILLLAQAHDTKVFPPTTNLTCTITAHSNANTWSSWVELQDSGATTFSSVVTADTHITSILIEWASVTDKLFVLEISFGDDKTVVSRIRFTSGDKNFLPPIQMMRIRSSNIFEDETIYYRLMSETGGATCKISIRYHYH